jgi:hypothetical protein
VKSFLPFVLSSCFAIWSTVCFAAETQHKSDPLADPQAVVMIGNARFTVLTPQLIRMEWSPDGKFEDHASLVFLNRKLPVPKIVQRNEKGWHTIKTDELLVKYKPTKTEFTAQNLSVSFELNGKRVVWTPGMKDTANLRGTTRTLDAWKERLISRQD